MNAVNFGGMEKTAAGTPTPKYQKEEKNGVQTNITPYSFGNTPAQYQDSLRGQYASSPTTYRAASAAWEAIPQQERDRVDQMYAQIPTEKWQQMGLQAPQAIAPTNAQDPADNLAAYKAKLYAINNAPAPGKMYTNVDQSAKIGLQGNVRLHGQEVMEAIREGNREKLAGMKHTWKTSDTAAQSQVLDEAVSDMVTKAKKDTDNTVYVQSNPMDPASISKEVKLSVGPELKKSLSIQDPDDIKHRIDADDVYYNESKGTVTPIFYLPGKPHTKDNIDPTYSKPMTMGEFKATFGKTYFGVREAAKETTPARTRVTSGITWQ